jgi:predicted anti-sigma-YlaC factor YlaD
VSACLEIRPLLARVADGEVSPEEAIRVGLHLPDCTGCRILLARERRLAAMLEQDLEDRLHVGEEFVKAVMAAVPEAPPARRRRERGRATR